MTDETNIRSLFVFGIDVLSRICLSHILQIEDTTASGVEKDVCNLILLRFEMRNQIVLHCGISGRECRSAIKTLLYTIGLNKEEKIKYIFLQ